MNDNSLMREESILLREMEVLDEGAKIDKLKKIVIGTKKVFKSLYTVSDEDLIQGKHLKELGKGLVRMVGVVGLTAASIPIGAGLIGGLITAFVGVSTMTVNRVIKQKASQAQRDRLKDFYVDKLDYMNLKIDREDNPEAKYKLTKIRTDLQRDAEKVSIWAKKSE